MTDEARRARLDVVALGCVVAVGLFLLGGVVAALSLHVSIRQNPAVFSPINTGSLTWRERLGVLSVSVSPIPALILVVAALLVGPQRAETEQITGLRRATARAAAAGGLLVSVGAAAEVVNLAWNQPGGGGPWAYRLPELGEFAAAVVLGAVVAWILYPALAWRAERPDRPPAPDDEDDEEAAYVEG